MKQNRPVFLAALALLIILVVICFVIMEKQGSIAPQRMEVADLMMTKLWNDEVVNVPGPMTVPAWMKQSKTYRTILERGSVSNLTWSDIDGNTYVAHAIGRMKNKVGKPYVLFSKIEKRRPDSSLENETLLAGDSKPFEWSIMNEDGNRIMFVSKGAKGGGEVAFFEDGEDNFSKEWEFDPALKIFSEQVRGENGSYHFTHNLR